MISIVCAYSKTLGWRFKKSPRSATAVHLLPNVVLNANCLKAAVLQVLKKKRKTNNRINGKYWSSYVQWRSLLLLTP